MKDILHSFGFDVSGKWMELLLAGSHILIILILSWVFMRFSGKLINIFKNYITRTSRDAGSIKRAETLSQVFSHVAIVVITLVTGMLLLGEVGISIAPILAAAGVLGMAIAFGAQSLIKDYFNGFFLLLEDQIRHGEYVQVAGETGVVEEVTLRHVMLRDNHGTVHYIPNGIITTVSNHSRDFSYALIEIGVAYRENVDAVYAEMRKVGNEMRSDPLWQTIIVEDLHIVGVQELSDSAVIIRCRFKVQALENANTRREFLYRIKKAFDLAGIEIPYPHMTLYAGQAKLEGLTPAFKIQARPMDIG